MTVPAPLEDETYEARLAEYHRRAGTANRGQRDRIAANLDRLRAANPEPSTRMGARTIGDMAIVELGCEIWARTGVDGLMRPGDDGDPELEGVQARGGIVVEITDTTSVTDDGEIMRARAFRCFDYDPRLEPFRAYTTLTEAQVDPARFDPPKASLLKSVVRGWCRQVGAGKGPLNTFEAQLVTDAAHLTALLLQRGY